MIPAPLVLSLPDGRDIVLATVLPTAYLGFSGRQKRSSLLKAVVGRVADWEPGSGANRSIPVSKGEHMRRCRFTKPTRLVAGPLAGLLFAAGGSTARSAGDRIAPRQALVPSKTRRMKSLSMERSTKSPSSNLGTLTPKRAHTLVARVGAVQENLTRPDTDYRSPWASLSCRKTLAEIRAYWRRRCSPGFSG